MSFIIEIEEMLRLDTHDCIESQNDEVSLNYNYAYVTLKAEYIWGTGGTFLHKFVKITFYNNSLNSSFSHYYFVILSVS